MAKPDYKTRTRAHIIADLSANHVQRFVLKMGQTVESVRSDYGYIATGRTDMNQSTTYGKLFRALTDLGFVCVESDRNLIFREQAHGAVLVLPRVRLQDEVRAEHLISARQTVVGNGVTDLDGFASTLSMNL